MTVHLIPPVPAAPSLPTVGGAAGAPPISPYSRLALVDIIRDRAVNLMPITVGYGPYDHDPRGAVCAICEETFVPEAYEGTPGTLGYGLWVRETGAMLLLHVLCVREAEACPCECHTPFAFSVHGPDPDSVCCRRWDEVLK